MVTRTSGIYKVKCVKVGPTMETGSLGNDEVGDVRYVFSYENGDGKKYYFCFTEGIAPGRTVASYFEESGYSILKDGNYEIVGGPYPTKDFSAFIDAYKIHTGKPEYVQELFFNTKKD